LKKNTVLPTTFDEYRIVRQISQGGNGTVFLAKNAGNDEVAIKVVDKARTTQDKLRRFKNEIAFCQNNQHPNIVKILDNGALKQDQLDVIFYVMPYYPHTLRDEMQNDLTPEKKLNIFLQLLRALGYAHDKNIWHRDVKPENVLMDESGNVILADFGIAHFCDEYLITAVETKAADRLANFQYSAPEQRVKGSMVNGSADIYAAGLILNELFTGKVIGGSAYTKIADVNAGWSYLDALIDEMIAQEPSQRLFPVEKVVFRLEVLDSERKVQAELAKLSVSMPKVEDRYTPVAEPLVIGADYANGQLMVKLNSTMPIEWCNTLINGHYTHSEIGNYRPYSFSSRNGDTFIVQMNIYDEQLIPRIIDNFKGWIKVATQMYNQNMQAKFWEQEKREREQKQAAIEKAQAELRIKESLRLLF